MLLAENSTSLQVVVSLHPSHLQSPVPQQTWRSPNHVHTASQHPCRLGISTPPVLHVVHHSAPDFQQSPNPLKPQGLSTVRSSSPAPFHSLESLTPCCLSASPCIPCCPCRTSVRTTLPLLNLCLPLHPYTPCCPCTLCTPLHPCCPCPPCCPFPLLPSPPYCPNNPAAPEPASIPGPPCVPYHPTPSL